MSDSVLVVYREACPSMEESQFGFLSEDCVLKQAISHERLNPFSALRMKDAGH